MAENEPIVATELHLDDRAVEVAVPYNGLEYKCPNCEQMIPTRKQNNLSKPAKYAHMLNDVQKCPFCSFLFSYRSRAVVLRS